MQQSLDTMFALGLSALTVVFSAAAYSRTDAGNVTTGWRDGAYQRGFETRFEQSIPAHDSSAALWATLRWVLFDEPAEGAVAGKDGWLFTAEEFSEPTSTRHLADELKRVSDRLAVHDIALVPVIIPDKARIHEDRLARGRSAGFSSRYARALETIDHAGLTVIDLRPALAFDQSFLRTDTHWSPSGAERAAQAIAAALADHALPETTVTTQASGEKQFDGDLLPFVATGPYRDRFGPSPVRIRTFETTVDSNQGLFGDAEIPVALVGTSYSAKPDFHFEGFLKTALKADVLNVSAIGQGPFVPMDAFLNDLDQLSTLPSLVIWEIPERYLTTRSSQI